MSSIYVLQQPHISSLVLLSGTPTLWLREDGTICPFGVLLLFRSHFWSNLRPIPVMRPIVVSFFFPLFCRHFGCFWVLPKLTTMLGVILSDHIPGDLNLTLTLTANSN